MRFDRRAAAALLLSLCATGCGDVAASDGGGFGGGSGGGSDGGASPAPPQACATVADCPAAHTCEAFVCVPPEEEVSVSLAERPPVASPRYVYALNAQASSVARIDPASLAIEALTVGPGPVALFALPSEDVAVVLSSGDSSLSLVDSTSLPSRVKRLPLKRRQDALAVSPDGRFAVCFPSPHLAPSNGAEGIVTVVDLAAFRQGAPESEVRFERAAGFRITDVVFRMENGEATNAYVFAKSTVSSIDLADWESVPLPTRLALPASMSADVNSREVVADADGHNVVLRATAAPELAHFDGTTLRTVALPETATDLDLLPDGTAAVAALRAQKQIALIDVPGDLVDPTGIQLFDAGTGNIGQIALPPQGADGGMFALAYTNAQDDESFVRVDLPSGAVTRFALEKWIDSIDVSPDGRSAVIVHRSNPAPTTGDAYERAVDLDEGYSVFDVATGYAQLKRTGKVRPGPLAFSPVGGFAGIALRDPAKGNHALDALDLSTLVATTLPLPTPPLFMGSVPLAQGRTAHRVFLAQEHPAGRISVIQLDDLQIRTATGFTLNSEIE